MSGIKRVMPWQPTAQTGPKWGVAVSPETMAKIISDAENPIIIVGGEINALDGKLLDFVIRLSKIENIPIVATAHSIRSFVERKVDATLMGLVEVTNLLLDPVWGLKGEPHDLAIFVGIQYALNNQVFNTLKNFSEIKTMNLSKYYQPNAGVSFANLTDDIWEDYLEKICEKVV
ncbi:MAG: CO dehydrogenase/acetyl-CoA synthase complex subunit epsilon [Candidatus Hydrothermarchaeales archaeon]